MATLDQFSAYEIHAPTLARPLCLDCLASFALSWLMSDIGESYTVGFAHAGPVNHDDRGINPSQ